ncbi:IS110 family transposase [Caballeronia ptereochthonis]|uniref:Transposase n=1 Tax=Caballeronia ptereochthonis TaxID=1777144 RepID=A0A158DAY2_9BURK|nr:IS110 family transposase [Caballeronia ptereochthonis]SAK91815.1 transposase [Caballeronia ptereochthonis]
MENAALIGLDLGKNVIHLHGQDRAGQQVFRKKVARTQLLKFCAALPPCTVGMEACGGAHFIARELAALGHQVKLVSPRFVRPFVKSSKSDFVDAEAVCEAVSRPSMRFVAPKSPSQQTLSALHRVRQTLLKDRVRTGNQIYAFLLEFGVSLPPRSNLAKHLPSVLASQSMPPSMVRLLTHLQAHFVYLQAQIAVVEKELSSELAADELGQRLLTIPGIGPITASALAGELGDGRQFASGRDFAAWLGLVPRQRSTGGKTTLLGIGPGTGKPLHTLLILCAHSYMRSVHRKTGPLAEWVRAVKLRRATNIVACALANKLARIAWAIASQHSRFEPEPMSRRLPETNSSSAP